MSKAQYPAVYLPFRSCFNNFQSELGLLPKVALGVRSVFKYTGGISPGFAAAFGSRFRKLAENSRIQEKNSSHFECSLYILDSIGFYPSLLIDRKENIPIDAMRGGERKVFDRPTSISRGWRKAKYNIVASFTPLRLQLRSKTSVL